MIVVEVPPLRSTDRIESPKGKERRSSSNSERGGRDRRVFQRANRVLPVWYRHEGRYRQGCALDLSSEGAALITEVEFNPGDQFEFTVQVEVDWEVRATATVLWRESAPDNVTHMIGVNFRTERPGDKSLLGPWIHRNSERKKQKPSSGNSPKKLIAPPPDEC